MMWNYREVEVKLQFDRFGSWLKMSMVVNRVTVMGWTDPSGRGQIFIGNCGVIVLEKKLYRRNYDLYVLILSMSSQIVIIVSMTPRSFRRHVLLCG